VGPVEDSLKAENDLLALMVKDSSPKMVKLFFRSKNLNEIVPELCKLVDIARKKREQDAFNEDVVEFIGSGNNTTWSEGY
jgi:hypothetical protein